MATQDPELQVPAVLLSSVHGVLSAALGKAPHTPVCVLQVASSLHCAVGEQSVAAHKSSQALAPVTDHRSASHATQAGWGFMTEPPRE